MKESPPISLEKLMPPHTVRTVNLDYVSVANEHVVHQYNHLAAARAYEDAKEQATRFTNDNGDLTAFAPVFGALRAMTMEATASKITAFDRVQRSAKRSTFAPAVSELRSHHFSIWHFIQSTIFKEAPFLDTAGDCLASLLTGSPKGRFFVNYL